MTLIIGWRGNSNGARGGVAGVGMRGEVLPYPKTEGEPSIQMRYREVKGKPPKHLPKLETAGDCSVIALMILKACSYEKAFNLMRDVAGRRWRNKDGSKCKRLWGNKFMNVLPKLSGIPWDDGVAASNGSVGRFVKEHPKGKFLMWVKGHCFALIDGVIVDREAQSPHRHIFIAYEFR